MTPFRRFLSLSLSDDAVTFIRDGPHYVTFGGSARYLTQIDATLKLIPIAQLGSETVMVKVEGRKYDWIARQVLARGYGVRVVDVEEAKANDLGRKDGRIARSA